ncbi:GNAT family N-acetyltransferase [Anaerosolibacter sp.]|uniref:GNAT family N-acetyltransferase n=1 Tax=Anaerosolibacter sp. TaxID=1872527 RepID=UPI0039F014A9
MVEFYDITYDEIKVIKGLWEKNRQYHERSSEYFRELYQSINFEQRIKGLEVFDQDLLKITVARKNDAYIGYCLSTVSNGKGEVESIHVDAACRGDGVGEELMKRHIQWLRNKNCTVIGVTVSQENESTISFYKKLGFYPNTVYMQLK